jgi:hypothetical protein
MDISIIDQEFKKYIYTPKMYKQMRITHNHQKLLRNHLKRGISISLDKKLRLLQRAGWRSDKYSFTHSDLVLLAKFCINSTEVSRGFGPEYLVEKFVAQKMNK